MKDPKVLELVKRFKAEVNALNKTYVTLQNEGMYIDIGTEHHGDYTNPKKFVIKRMTQSVEYFREKTNDA